MTSLNSTGSWKGINAALLITIPVLLILCTLGMIFGNKYERYLESFGLSHFHRLNMSDQNIPQYIHSSVVLPVDEYNITSKVVWLYWNDGKVDAAPYVVRKAIESWMYHNSPNWTIVILHQGNLHQYMDTSLINSKKSMTTQAKSDVIRLTLMATHGGVWADATMLCFEPLDNWVWNVLPPKGFFMFSKSCSWFMIAAKDSYLAKQWYRAAMQYWSTREVISGNVGGKQNYYWMDGVLLEARSIDPELDSAIENITDMVCNGYCKPHGMFDFGCKYAVNQPLHDDMKQCFDHNPPVAMKMTYKTRCDSPGIKSSKNYHQTNGHYAIHVALHSKGSHKSNNSSTAVYR
jgi:hypothetical protein